jgi:hypothetical protein
MGFTVIRYEDKTLQLLVNGFDMGPFYVTPENQRDLLRWDEQGKLEYIDLGMYENAQPRPSTPEEAKELLRTFEGEGHVNE